MYIDTKEFCVRKLNNFITFESYVDTYEPKTFDNK